MLESVEFAVESLKGNRLRTALSLVGIVIGVASVVAVTAIAASGSADLSRQFQAFGLDAVQVYVSGPPGPGREAPALDEALARDIVRELPDAKAALARSGMSGRLARGRLVEEGRVTAVESPYFDAMGAPLAIGRGFSPEDEYRCRPVAVLGDTMARSLFPEGEPVGKRLDATISGVPMSLEVIGVLAPKDSPFMDEWDRSAFIPWATARGRISGGLLPDDLTVVARSRDRVIAMGDALETWLASRSGRPDAFGVMSPRKWAAENEKMTGTISLILGGVAAISLLVGGIGVMNIMLVSVTERKREIGLRKALGATRRDLRGQFLVEASVLTVSGGIIGLAFGFAISWFAVRAFGWRLVASPSTALLAFGVSLATGLFSGIYPAIRAARLDPVEALAAE